MRTRIAAGLLLVLAGAPFVPARAVTVPDGTEVTVRLLEAVSSETAQVEDAVLFEAVDDVVVDGVTVIARGARGKGTVLFAEKRKSFGRKGKLDFSIDVVEAVTGYNVRLRATRELRGRDMYGVAGVVTILTGPFGFFVKGKNIVVPAGTEYTIYIDGERSVEATG